VFGLVGVLLGSASTSVVAIYQERLANKRERDARDHERAQVSRAQRDAFQRESVMALQDAVTDLVKAVFDEQDRMLQQMGKTTTWPTRRWETPTAVGWVDAEIRLQVARARVFNDDLRTLARDARAVAMKSVWADSLDEAKRLNPHLEQLCERFNELVAQVLRELY
jgi:hypothetical protein